MYIYIPKELVEMCSDIAMKRTMSVSAVINYICEKNANAIFCQDTGVSKNELMVWYMPTPKLQSDIPMIAEKLNVSERSVIIACLKKGYDIYDKR